jgi:3-(3-hydroxy-phenyl)propionate hydroxylase
MTTAAGRPRVVIVGAGPTGVTAAILLGQHGVPTLVLDRWSEVYPQPRAVHLDDEVYRIIARLGLADDFAAISRSCDGLRLLGPDHRVLAQFDRADPLTENGYPQANMFDQPELETLLRNRIKDFPSVELRGNVEIEHVETTPDGLPVVHLTDRITGARDAVLADYVLGCDGANSTVRQAIGSSLTNLGFEQRWLVVDIATARELGHWDGVHQLCDGRRAGTYMRIGEHRHRWEFELCEGESVARYADLEALAPLLAPWTARTDDLELVRVAEYTFRARIADRWRRDRVFLLGDAAHLTPPFIGQGMGAGVRDAANLAWKLAEVVQGRLAPDVLDSYEQERKPHALAMIRLAVLVGRAMTGGGPVGDHIRRLVVPVLPWLPVLRSRFIESRTPALNRSALVHRGRSLAGTLCPNVVLGTGTRFDDIVRGRFALVTTAALDDATASTAAAAGIVVVPAERGGRLDRWLRRGRATSALVRPDGTVLAATRTMRAMISHLQALEPASSRTRE